MSSSTETRTRESLRKLGQARLDIPKQAKTPEDFKRLWTEPAQPFNMKWGDCWTFAPCYHVEDFAAEVGFWLDVMGFDSNAITEDFCMVMDPEKRFTFSIRPASEQRSAPEADPAGNQRAVTPAEALTLEFMVDGIREICAELAERGVDVERHPEPYGAPSSPMYTALLRTPAGLRVWLWGLVSPDAT